MWFYILNILYFFIPLFSTPPPTAHPLHFLTIEFLFLSFPFFSPSSCKANLCNSFFFAPVSGQVPISFTYLIFSSMSRTETFACNNILFLLPYTGKAASKSLSFLHNCKLLFIPFLKKMLSQDLYYLVLSNHKIFTFDHFSTNFTIHQAVTLLHLFLKWLFSQVCPSFPNHSEKTFSVLLTISLVILTSLPLICDDSSSCILWLSLLVVKAMTATKLTSR